MKILKFGGRSLENLERIRTTIGLIREAGRDGRVTVVVSAMAGITDALETAARMAATGALGSQGACEEIFQRHVESVRQLASADEVAALEASIEEQIEELRDLLHGVSLVRECTPRTRDLVDSYGERLAAMVVAAALRAAGTDAEACDARRLIVTDRRFGGARVALEESERRIRAHFEGENRLQVVTGFIAATEDGETTTLGRGGGDMTAALLGAALAAEAIELWTSTDGVMSADPALVPEAFPLNELSYEELLELSHFGTSVVNPPNLHPARARNIPLVIRNILNPVFPGTRVVAGGGGRGRPLCGVSSISRVALLRLQGDGMIGVPGTAGRLFGALAREGINVLLITQAASEHSICLAVLPQDVERAKQRIEQEFALEHRSGLVDDLVVETDLAILAAVGEEMKRQPGAAGRLFRILGRERVNVRAIAQGSSELNISVVVDGRDERRALKAIHEAFFIEGEESVQVFVAGTGRVGTTLLDQLEARAPHLAASRGVRLRLAGLCSSSEMLLDPSGSISEVRASWESSVPGERRKADTGAFAAAVAATPGARVLVDCTAGDAVPAHYRNLLERGVAVVTANKRPLSGPAEVHAALMNAAARGNTGLFHEVTVGAGLPVVGTLRDLVDGGDSVEVIEGVLSGSIAFILDRVGRGARFSDAVREAQEQGFTEPDPREDLCGRDVARKLLILARVAGWKLEPREVKVEPLLPDGTLENVTLEEFWKELPGLDPVYADRFASARSQGKVLCYIAHLHDGDAHVALEPVDPSHPCAGIRGTDNLVAFQTRNYSGTPLVVKGPGAGPDVAAGGLLADILRAAAACGLRRMRS